MSIARRLIRWFTSKIDADGLDTTEYVEHLEREFAIRIPNEAAESLITLGDLCAHVAAQRQQQGRPLPEEEIWDNVRRITSHEFGVDPGGLHPGIRYVEDLNC
jgi:hypothetical protein